MATFGDEAEHTLGGALGHTIHGTKDTAPSAGIAQSITVKIKGTQVATVNIKCALYKVSDGSFVAETEERTVSITTSWAWETFVFSAPKPSIENITYYILAWAGAASGGDAQVAVTTTAGAYKRVYETETYDGWPDPTEATEYNGSTSIYCTYAVPTAHEVTITDSVGMLDSVAKSWGRKLTISDKVGMLDSVPAPKGAFKQAITDIVGMLDSAATAKGFRITISDIVGLRDRIVTRKKIWPLRDLPDDTIQGGA